MTEQVVHITEGEVRKEPIVVDVLRSAADGRTIPHQLRVVAEPNSEVTVVEHYRGSGRYRLEAETELELGPGARVRHVIWQDQPGEAVHQEAVRVKQARDSHYASHLFSLGAAEAKVAHRVALQGEGAEASLYGLFIGSGRQKLEQETLVEHETPRATSRELYKGVLDDAAHGVFTGKIIVHPGAFGSDAQMTTRNLLLSRDAEVDPRPQLEIYNDDVKCTHGATVGCLDEAALFYLRSRGLPLQEARRLLTDAFAREIVESLPPAALWGPLASWVGQRLKTMPFLQEGR